MISLGRLHAALFLCLILSSCSSDSDGGSNGEAQGAAAKSTFSAAANKETRQWGQTAAAMFISNVTSTAPNAPAIAAHNKPGIAVTLCGHLATFQEETRDSDDSVDLETEALEFAEKSAVDSAVSGLFEHALAAQPPERDRLLNLLLVGANHANDPASQVNGIEALQQAELLDATGRLVVPSTEYLKGSDPEGPYERYRNWFSRRPSVVVAATTLASGIKDSLRECADRS